MKCKNASPPAPQCQPAVAGTAFGLSRRRCQYLEELPSHASTATHHSSGSLTHSSCTKRFLRCPAKMRPRIWLYALVWVRKRMYCRQYRGRRQYNGEVRASRGQRQPGRVPAETSHKRRQASSCSAPAPSQQPPHPHLTPSTRTDSQPAPTWLEPTPSPMRARDAWGTWRMRGTRNSATSAGSSARQLTKNLRWGQGGGGVGQVQCGAV